MARHQAIAEPDLAALIARHSETNEPLAEVILQSGKMTTAELAPYLEQAIGFPYIDLTEREFNPDAVATISETFCVENLLLPVDFDDDRLIVAMYDPLDFGVIDELRAMSGYQISPRYALRQDIEIASRRAFDVRNKTRAIIEQISEEALAGDFGSEESDGLPETPDAPIVRIVNQICTGAVASGASDIHIEPAEDHVKVRYRIDGILYEHLQLPRQHLSATMSRLKVMSGLDIAERRRPQDGRFGVRDDAGRDFDVRLSIMPTIYGEKACMRLLEKKNTLAHIDKIGLLPDQRVTFERMIHRPHGLILVTGPTGSGKSTTLYAALQHINEPSININTVEDPVEYKLGGINQMQVNPKIGVTFASGLRTLVRQDPDVILVGEIRDKETAEISVQAALTGHLVLSTLHTNDAPGALVRLQNMGVEPFLISSAVIGVLGQRLMRCNCPACKEPYEVEYDYALAIGMHQQPGEKAMAMKGAGCKRCNMRGTKGRTAAIEIMTMSDALRELILGGASGAELTDTAIKSGMRTMRESAIEKVRAGVVPPQEVMRVFAHEED
ncbi:MAG: GspE/PulE family protein [Fimbriimonadaceae bacterium]|nr:GspE/PulE family protein [Fimbriimonadaceae bacterium]